MHIILKDLIQCQFLPGDQLFPVSDNEIDKFDQLACCLFGFNVALDNFSVISRRCLVATGSSVLTFIVLPD